MSRSDKVLTFLQEIPSKRIFLAATRLGVSPDDVTESNLTITHLVCNELLGRKSGNYDNYVELGNWGYGKLNDLLKEEFGDEEDDSKSSEE